MAGRREKLLAPEAADEAMMVYTGETNRHKRERRASGATDRKEVVDIEKMIKAMAVAIEDGGTARGMMDRLREREARKTNGTNASPPSRPTCPTSGRGTRTAAGARSGGLPRRWPTPATATRRWRPYGGPIERIALTPGGKRGEMHAALHGDLGTILQWVGSGNRKGATDTRGMQTPVVAWARYSRDRHALVVDI